MFKNRGQKDSGLICEVRKCVLDKRSLEEFAPSPLRRGRMVINGDNTVLPGIRKLWGIALWEKGDLR